MAKTKRVKRRKSLKKAARAAKVIKVRKRKYTRRVKVASATLPNLPTLLANNNLPNALKDIPPRMLMLNEAAQAVGIEQTQRLGDPIFAFEGIAALKTCVLESCPSDCRQPAPGDANTHDPRVIRTATPGHSIDMILMSSAGWPRRRATTIKRDTLLDLVSYTAILYETAAAQGQLSAE